MSPCVANIYASDRCLPGGQASSRIEPACSSSYCYPEHVSSYFAWIKRTLFEVDSKIF
jgi:hypothetical protein